MKKVAVVVVSGSLSLLLCAEGKKQRWKDSNPNFENSNSRSDLDICSFSEYVSLIFLVLNIS